MIIRLKLTEEEVNQIEYLISQEINANEFSNITEYVKYSKKMTKLSREIEEQRKSQIRKPFRYAENLTKKRKSDQIQR